MRRNPVSESVRETQRAIQTLKRDEQFFDNLKSIDCYPHSGQQAIIKRILSSGAKRVFLRCSRNFGKSFLAATIANLLCSRRGGEKGYIIAPQRNQAEEIYWQSGIVQKLPPRDWLLDGDQSMNKSELRTRWKNGSYLKLDGIDNEDACRGYKPTFLICDEFQDWKKEAWESMEPNLLAHDALCIFLGTPPRIPGLYNQMRALVEKRQAEGNKKYILATKTIYDNPRYTLEQIEEMRQNLLEREGPVDGNIIWRREYMAEEVEEGASNIFPMFSRRENTRPLNVIQAMIKGARSKRQYITVSDPSGTRHATGFFCYLPEVSQMFMLGEIVETDESKLSAGQLSVRIKEKEKELYELYEDPWRIYDEAAKLYAIEMMDHGIAYTPTQKKQNEKSNNISLVRDMIIRKKLTIAEECTETIGDIQRYHRDEKGHIVKKMDDCVDVLLYATAETGYTFSSSPIIVASDSRSFYTPEEDIRRHGSDESDWAPKNDFQISSEDVEEILWN